MSERNIGAVVVQLSRTFNTAIRPLGAPHRPKKGPANAAYAFQTEFAYAINELTAGPAATAQRYIAECNDIIDRAMQYVASLPDRK